MMQFLARAAPSHQIDPVFGSHHIDQPANRYLNSRSMSTMIKISTNFPLMKPRQFIDKKTHTHTYVAIKIVPPHIRIHDFDQCRCTKYS